MKCVLQTGKIIPLGFLNRGASERETLFVIAAAMIRADSLRPQAAAVREIRAPHKNGFVPSVLVVLVHGQSSPEITR